MILEDLNSRIVDGIPHRREKFGAAPMVALSLKSARCNSKSSILEVPTNKPLDEFRIEPSTGHQQHFDTFSQIPFPPFIMTLPC